MYYESNDIESILKCSFCQSKFIGVVKLVPDCGSSICGECYEALNDELDESSRFKCKECREFHTLPKTGLGDNKLAMRMLEQRPKQKALSEKAAKLKSVMDQAEDSIAKLQGHNEFEVINSYCDSLEQDIWRSVDNEVELLYNLGGDLVDQVNKYREMMIASRTGNVKASNEERKARLEALSVEMSAFSKEWSARLTHIDKAASDDKIERAQKRIDKLLAKTNDLEEEIKNEVFAGRFLEFQENHTLSFSLDHVGKLAYSGSKDPAKLDDPVLSNDENLFLALKNVNRVAFFTNDDIVTGSDKIEVWSHQSGKKLYELKRKSSSNVLSLAVLRNGWLASGLSDSSIVIWNLEERKEIRTLTGHAQGVFTLKALRNDNLASCAWDSNIKIWNPLWESGNLIRTISLLGSVGQRFDLGELPNGHLVALSLKEAVTVIDDEFERFESETDDEEVTSEESDDDEANYSVLLYEIHKKDASKENNQHEDECPSSDDSDLPYEPGKQVDNGEEDDDDVSTEYESEASEHAIQIWDPSSGNLVKNIDEHGDPHSTFLALSGGKLAIGSLGSRIKLVDLTSDGKTVELSCECHVGQINSLLELPNGYLASSGFDDELFSAIKFWDPQSKKLIKTIKLNQYLTVDQLDVSASGKLLACVQENMAAKIWRLNF